MSVRENILQALFAQIQVTSAGTVFQRNGILPNRLAAAGLAILRDGDPGEPEVSLSPLRYHYEHKALLEVMVQNEANQDALLDSILVAIGEAIALDRTLGGLCDFVEPMAPNTDTVPIDGGEPVLAASVELCLYYATENPI